MNSNVWPIFNEKIAEKWSLWVSWIMHETHWCALYTGKVNNHGLKKKKKKNEREKTQTLETRETRYPNVA